MQDDLIYYKQRVVQIITKEGSGVLPDEQSLRSSLASFGDIWHFQTFSTREQPDNVVSSDTVIVVFSNQAAVKNTLGSSRNESSESFWHKHSLKAQILKKKGPLYETFLMKIIPKLRQESHVPPSGPNAPSRISDHEDQPNLSYLDDGPSLKRARGEDWGITPDGSTSTGNHGSTSKLSRTPSALPDSTEWMRARITQLEEELGAAQASRDMSISEQDVLRTAYEAEQRARREAMSQKSVAEAALSQAKFEQDRLRTVLGAKLSFESAPLDDQDGLYQADDDVKPLQRQSGEGQQNAQPLHQKLHIGVSNAHEFEETKATIRQLRSEVQRFKLELASTKEQLESTQCSLKSMERRHSSTLEQYESTKEGLETYKLKLEKEQTLMQKLKTDLIPQVYKTLGATHEALEEVLSAMGQSPTSGLGEAAPSV